MKILASIAFVALLSGCVTESEHKEKPAWSRLSETPFQKRRALYARMEAEGSITHEQREAMTKQWQAQKPFWESEQKAKERRAVAVKKAKAEHERWVASLTPAQKLDVKARERESQARQEQFGAQATPQTQPQETQATPSPRQEHTVVYPPPGDAGGPQ